MPKHDWKCYFPYDAPRKEQIEAIDFIIDAFENGKKFAICELGTGSGKSAIGVTVAKYISHNFPVAEKYHVGGTILTTQKLLQDQYEKDFTKSSLVSLKSSSNYQCKHLPKQSCAETRPLLENEPKGTKLWNTCVLNCTYKKKKEEFINSQMGVTNFAYFLNETKYSGKIQKRQIMIVDEAHNLPDELSKFIEVSFSEKFAKSFLDLTLPQGLTPRKMVSWIQNEYYPVLLSKKMTFESNMEKYGNLSDKIMSGELSKLTKKLELLSGHESKVATFLEIWDAENWLMEEIPAEEKSGRKFQFKPIDVGPYADSYIHSWGEFVILMSATILDEDGFMKLCGVTKDNAVILKTPSPFPVENHPIIYAPVGSMGNKDIETTLPKLVDAIKEILKAHKNEKGIIHCNSYKIAWYIKKNIRSTRLLIHDSSDRDDVLKKHISSKEPTVLLSPSMTEGVDLKDDLSRFQIICKIPFPYLGDKLISKKMHKWDWWYDLQTAKTLIQAVGRSIRNDEDTAVTYILDAIWERFYSKNRKIFPENFNKSIQ